MSHIWRASAARIASAVSTRSWVGLKPPWRSSRSINSASVGESSTIKTRNGVSDTGGTIRRGGLGPLAQRSAGGDPAGEELAFLGRHPRLVTGRHRLGVDGADLDALGQ